MSSIAANNINVIREENMSLCYLLDRLEAVNWLSSFGGQGDDQVEQALHKFVHFFGLDGIGIRWLQKNELVSFIEEIRLENDDSWRVLRHIPEQLRQQTEQTGRSRLLSAIADEVPAVIFQHSFDAIFEVLRPYGNKVVTTAVGYMMYIGGMACAWEVLSDLEGWKENPFLYLVSVLESGHWPLGIVNRKFVVI
ncbi:MULTISPECIES: hypothetical protein [Geobacillus]|uniref:Uncharacterized protein n=1 Tax=Geobacillus zalihae TaxID=213419 RepID=A0A7H1RWV3_9BACL|nr:MULTISPECIES: hypothetical protein [Geobacillus]ADU93898.1 hypothetical protein GYMC52_1445 [Geobacillus sp. Y412MC52]AGE22034.1 hypothetical protein GHH_c15030 [Geobacillus sp. GHH01]AMQ20381.1 hypothetical protein A0V43_04750 [Geobacillus sp. JS12]OQP23614.1 hypothetical protein B1694_08315 [Geobacillus zalihae]QNU18742.1 hypothetical protein IC807_03460 [Geobacillus zalihae]